MQINELEEKEKQPEPVTDNKPEEADVQTEEKEPSGTIPEEPEVKPSGEDQTAEVTVLLERLLDGQDRLCELFEKRLQYDSEKESSFQRLYDELDAVKKERTLHTGRALFLDLIRLLDRVDAYLASGGEGVQAMAFSLRGELEEALYRQGIEKMAFPDQTYNPRYQRVLKRELVDSRERDGLVLHVLRDGFFFHDLVIRPQDVVTGVYQKKQDTVEASGQSPAGDMPKEP